MLTSDVELLHRQQRLSELAVSFSVSDAVVECDRLIVIAAAVAAHVVESVHVVMSPFSHSQHCAQRFADVFAQLADIVVCYDKLCVLDAFEP